MKYVVVGACLYGCSNPVKPTEDYVSVEVNKVFDSYEAVVKAEDKDGLDKIVLQADNAVILGKKEWEYDGDKNAKIELDLEAIGNGSIRLYATAYDTKGNKMHGIGGE